MFYAIKVFYNKSQGWDITIEQYYHFINIVKSKQVLVTSYMLF